MLWVLAEDTSLSQKDQRKVVEFERLFRNKKSPQPTERLRAFGAPQQGLEPWTYGLTVRRSNQLSY